MSTQRDVEDTATNLGQALAECGIEQFGNFVRLGAIGGKQNSSRRQKTTTELADHY
jgi:hypothetical protein